MKFFDLSLELQQFKHEYKDLFDYRECRYDVKDQLYPTLISAFDNELLANSFTRPQVVAYFEFITTEQLLEIQQLLATQACHAENICLITNHTLGCSSWWKSYKKILGIKSFKIIEAPWFWLAHNFFISELPSEQLTKDFWLSNRQIDKLFCLYGGTKTSWIEHQYLILKALNFAHTAHVDFLAPFDSQTKIKNYVDPATLWINQAEVTHILDLYDHCVTLNGRLKKQSDAHLSPDQWQGFRWVYEARDEFSNNGLMQQVDQATLADIYNKFKHYLDQGTVDNRFKVWSTDRHCLAQVVREPRVFDQYCTVTEKTLRTFLHHMAYIPISGINNDKHIEQLGFKLSPGLIDYSYTKQEHYATKIIKMYQELERLQHWTADDLTQYYVENFDYFQYNFEYIVSQQLFLNIQKQLKEDFEQFLFKDKTC